jgi:HKD family nuclease
MNTVSHSYDDMIKNSTFGSFKDSGYLKIFVTYRNATDYDLRDLCTIILKNSWKFTDNKFYFMKNDEWFEDINKNKLSDAIATIGNQFNIVVDYLKIGTITKERKALIKKYEKAMNRMRSTAGIKIIIKLLKHTLHQDLS